jgi:hypothetical protein
VLNEAERATAVEGARLPEAVRPSSGHLPAEHKHSSPAAPRTDVANDTGDVISAAEADQTERSMRLPGVSSFPRRLNRRSGSGHAGGFSELIAVLVGGLLALPLSQLICWWGLGWDPFGVARKLRPELQWLAPAHLVADAPDTK